MSFISPEFCYLALIFYLVYWLLKPYQTIQKLYLIVASYLLYATWSIKFTLLLFIYSVFVWYGGRWIRLATINQRQRNLKIIISVLLSLSLLFVTKYYEFFRELINQAIVNLGWLHTLPFMELIVPAGISFFTFQAVTYLVWQGDQETDKLKEHHTFLDVVLFLVFWPTLFAGPIFRAKDFIHQLYGGMVGHAIQVEKAIYFILLGLFQKLVLANWLSEHFVEQVFAYPENQNLITALSGIWAYTLQIFFDFSGYSLLVTGLAFLLGFQVPINFKQPYLAKNIQDFWKRWHISLSTFIRDYIYIPLGGNQLGFGRTQINLMVAMTISGLWHGANMTFVIWGLLHAFGVVFLNLQSKYMNLSIPNLTARFLTLLFLAFTWIFFRADNLENAFVLMGQLSVLEGEITYETILLILLTVLFLTLSTRAAKIESEVISLLQHYWGWRAFLTITVAIFLMIYTGPSGIPGFIYYRF